MLLTRHANDNVAVAAVEALGRVGTRAAVEALLSALNSGNFFRVFPAIDVLGRSGDPRVIGPLAGLLDNRHYSLEAARALGRTGDRSAVGPLAQRLLAGSITDTRVAAQALAQLADEYGARYGVVTSLHELLRRTVDTRAATRRVGQALAGADPVEQAAMCAVLGAMGDEAAVPLLMPLLVAPEPVGAAAHRALAQLSRRPDDRLLEGLASEDPRARRAVLTVISHPSAQGPVVACLDDPDTEVRAAACDALARIGQARSAAALFGRLADPSPLVVQSAIAAIQSLGGSETEALALAAARDPDAAVRRWAIRILSYFGYPAALPVLLAALADGDLRVRDGALQGLVFHDSPQARDALLSASRSTEAKVRASAQRAFGQSMVEPRIEAAVLRGLDDPDAWVRYFACQGAGRLRLESALERLTARLQDEAGQVRVSAVEALSHFNHPLAARALTAAASSPEPDIRQAAIIGVGIARLAAGLPAVLTAARTGDVATRLLAVSSLAAFDDPEAILVLEGAAHDHEESVRNAALAALGQRPGSQAAQALIGLLRAPEHTRGAQQALATPVAGRIDVIVAALAGADDELAPLLTSALARLAEPAAFTALIGALGTGTLAARKAAAASLGALGTGEALRAVRTASVEDRDEEVRRICAVVLGAV